MFVISLLIILHYYNYLLFLQYYHNLPFQSSQSPVSDTKHNLPF